MPLFVTNSVTGETTIVDGSGATISGSGGKATIGSGSITVSGSDGAVSTFGSGSLTVSGSGAQTTYGSGSLSGAFGFAITGSLSVSGSNTITNYGSFVSNEAAQDFDFRVESSNNANMLFVDGGNDAVGIGTGTPITALDIHHNPTGLTNDTGGGEVVTFGTEDGTDTLAAGKLMYLNASGVWKYTDADAPATGGSQLLAIALGGAVSDGLLLRGFFDMTTYLAGTFDQGVPVYVSTTASQGDVGIPNGSGDFVRVIGYCTDTANVIYFNPDGTYIEIS